ncbi:MAG: DNA repair protein RadC [Burkholderiaceae bacterium]
MSIIDWPTAERPRERLLAHGVQGLSDAELLAIFLRTGTPGSNAIDLARRCLTVFGGLAGVFGAPQARFCAIEGLGPARYAQLQAALEMTRRSLGQALVERPLFDSPAAVRDYLRLTIGGKPHEVFLALFLDAQHRLLGAEELFRGTLAQTSVYPREVVKRALEINAAAIVFAHNHPSGIAEPSRADEMLTTALRNALDLVDIRTLDHFIVAGRLVYSFAEHGKL